MRDLLIILWNNGMQFQAGVQFPKAFLIKLNMLDKPQLFSVHGKDDAFA